VNDSQAIVRLLARPEAAGQTLQRRCFVSSSSSNAAKVSAAVERLRAAGWFVYDFTKSDLFGAMRAAGVSSFAEAMQIPYFRETAEADLNMLHLLGPADALLLILPAGFSAGWEAGVAFSRGARVVVATEGTPITDVPLIHADAIAESLDAALALLGA
jgi:hypothetical protein